MTASPLKTLLLASATVAAVSTRGAQGCDKLWNGICFTYAANDDVFWGSDCDFSGTDSGSALGGADKCGGFCKSSDTCERWSWTSDQGGTCYLKSKSPWTLVAAKGVQCGFRMVPHA
jgi:hypothetical protein